jgi:hypothetical protein
VSGEEAKMDKQAVKAVQWVDKLPPLRFGRSWAILSLAMLMFFVPVAAIAYALNGAAAVPAAAVAASVCWLGSTLALAGTARFGRAGVNGPLYTLAFGLAFNCGLPFFVGLVLHRAGGPLGQAGVFGLIVIFFQFALVVSTVLSLCLIKPAR